MSSLPDHTLLTQARDGDHQALGALMTRYRDRLRLFVAVRTRSLELGEEIVQETFLVACTTIDTLCTATCEQVTVTAA